MLLYYNSDQKSVLTTQKGNFFTSKSDFIYRQ